MPQSRDPDRARKVPLSTANGSCSGDGREPRQSPRRRLAEALATAEVMALYATHAPP